MLADEGRLPPLVTAPRLHDAIAHARNRSDVDNGMLHAGNLSFDHVLAMHAHGSANPHRRAGSRNARSSMISSSLASLADCRQHDAHARLSSTSMDPFGC